MFTATIAAGTTHAVSSCDNCTAGYNLYTPPQNNDAHGICQHDFH